MKFLRKYPDAERQADGFIELRADPSIQKLNIWKKL